MFSYIKDILKYSIQYACITHCFFEYVGDFVVVNITILLNKTKIVIFSRLRIYCSGPSMEPTLFSNNILLTERLTSRFHKHSRGDIIIAVSPTNPEQYVCKRVKGLPGDKIILEHHEVGSEQGRKTEEIAFPALTDEYVPKGFVWVEGDNKKNSSDSRYYGPIPLGLVKSRAVCRIWPLSEMKLL